MELEYNFLEIALNEVNTMLPESLELFTYSFVGFIHQKERLQFVVSMKKDKTPNYLRDIIIYVENNHYIVNYGDVVRQLPITPNNALSIVHFAKIYFPLFKK
jgi:hypothetical protein